MWRTRTLVVCCLGAWLYVCCSFPKAEATNYVNVALGKPTRQVDTQYGAVSSKAVDGNTNSQFYGGGTCTHTSAGPNRWWAVDLLTSHPIHAVSVTNRLQFSARLKNFYVYVSDSSPISIPSPDGRFAGELCFSYLGTFPSAVTRRFDCSHDIYGRYVYVVKTSTDELTLCDVQVFVDKNNLEVSRSQQKQFVQSTGRKIIAVSPFFSTVTKFASRIQCVAKCLSVRGRGVSTAVQFELTTRKCECIQKSGLDVSGRNYSSVAGWTLMELSSNS